MLRSIANDIKWWDIVSVSQWTLYLAKEIVTQNTWNMQIYPGYFFQPKWGVNITFFFSCKDIVSKLWQFAVSMAGIISSLYRQTSLLIHSLVVTFLDEKWEYDIWISKSFWNVLYNLKYCVTSYFWKTHF